MKRLLVFLLFATSALANPRDYALHPPIVPHFEVLEAVAPDPGGQANTFCAANLPCTVTGLWTFTTPPPAGSIGGTGISTSGNFNAVRYVDGTKFATCSAALADLGGNPGIVVIPSTYAGADCPTTNVDGYTWALTPVNQQIWDYRGPTATTTYDGCAFNGGVQGANSEISCNRYSSTPTETTSAAIFTHVVTGNLAAAGGNLLGVTNELDVSGAISGSPNGMFALDAEGHVRSTGGTIGDFGAISGFASVDRVGATTFITRAYAIRGKPCLDTSTVGGRIANCFGGYFDRQTAGTAGNWSVYSAGRLRLGFNTSDTGIDSEDSIGVVHHVFGNDNTDALELRPITDSKGLLFKNTSGVPLLQIDAGVTGIQIGGGISTTAPVSGNTGFQHKRSAGCTTAASIGGVCASAITVTWTAPFADTSYTAGCWASGAPTNLPGTPYIVTKAAGSLTVNYFAITAAAAVWATIDCVGVHD